MKLRDLLNVLDSDEFILTNGEHSECVRVYLGEKIDPYLDFRVKKIRPYDNGFEVLLSYVFCDNLADSLFPYIDGDTGELQFETKQEREKRLKAIASSLEDALNNIKQINEKYF